MRPIIREGIIAGVLGATSVAAWFFIIDLIVRDPFATPNALGRALFGLLDSPAAGAASVAVVIGYTIFHYVAFIVVGLIAAFLVSRAESEPSLLAGAIIFFVIFEVAFHALLSIFGSIPGLGTVTWYSVAVGNLIAAVVMGVYIWRGHPELKAELAYALGGEEPR